MKNRISKDKYNPSFYLLLHSNRDTLMYPTCVGKPFAKALRFGIKQGSPVDDDKLSVFISSG